MELTTKQHIKNILKDVMRGNRNTGEDSEAYLNRRAEQILLYLPEEHRPSRDSVKAILEEVFDGSYTKGEPVDQFLEEHADLIMGSA